MRFVQIPFAVVIALVWVFAVWQATLKPELTGLVTVITPVMLGATTFLLGRPVIQALRSKGGNGKPHKNGSEEK